MGPRRGLEEMVRGIGDRTAAFVRRNGERMALAGQIVLGLWMVAVILAAFMLDARHLGTLGQGARIIFFHIPTAWVTVLAFLVSSFYSVRYLLKRRRADDRRAANAAAQGIVFCLLATVSGAIFARITWGAFWNWDPRETSIFFLLLFYAAYLALRAAIADEETRARLSAAYNVLGIVVVPFLVFVAPRLTAFAGLHSEANQAVMGLQMDRRALAIFGGSLVGFTGIFLWTYTLANRLSHLEETLWEENE